MNFALRKIHKKFMFLELLHRLFSKAQVTYLRLIELFEEKKVF